MSSRLKLIFIVLGLAVVVSAVAAFVFLRSTAPDKTARFETKENQIDSSSSTADSSPEPTVGLQNLEGEAKNEIAQPPPAQLTPSERLQNDLKSLARNFAARFGSYSNQSNFENIKSLLPFMTEGFRRQQERFISQQASRGRAGIYFGITTRSLKAKLLRFDNKIGQAEIEVATQRQETIGSPVNTKVYQQAIIIEFKKEGGVWLVDSADWR